ncbi:MAG: lipocalin family protein [Saprospiraceae bacterium]|nr:lipocalin family protein [Bacteroidia bacterium]NNE14937.1 lipocalin family protein [Saprospiraceae bacterium]NNL92143.1 lipocalin family protein [Saprospiraceae bacterium]
MKNIACCLFFCFLISCANPYDATLLLGKWKTDSWIENDSGKKFNNKMDFNFSDAEHYEIDYGSEKEKGKYWISNDFLHTIEEGKAEKKVKIISMSKDTFVFEMNRTGTLETVTLLKQ